MIIEIPEYDKTNHKTRGSASPLPEIAPTATHAAADFLQTALSRPLNLHHLSRAAITLPGKQHPLGSTSLLFTAANDCFALHEPFSLAPEVVWFTVLSEIARVVKANPTRFGHLYSHNPAEQAIARVYIDDFIYGQPNDWTVGIAQFLPLLRERVPDGLMDTAVLSFSTATPESDVALLLAFMDGASPYYDYRMQTRCGIPRVRLEGSADDWRHIVHSAAALSEVFADPLAPYFAALLLVLEELADTAAGKTPELSFWRAIYKRENMSGGPYISGWLTTLLAHTVGHTGETVLRKPEKLDWRRFFEGKGGWGGSITSDTVVSHVSTVPFIWEYLGTPIPMEHIAGIIGVERDDAGFFCPRLGFAVNEPSATSPAQSP